MSATAAIQDTAQMIRTVESDFARNANARDAVALTEGFYAENAQLLPPNAPTIKGKAAIAEFWKGFLAAGCTDVELITGDVGAAGDLAYSVGAYGYTLDGARHIGKFMAVYQRQPNGGYRAIADAFSDNA